MPQAALSIVVPAFNEAERIAGTLEALAAWLTARGLVAELIVADDGSTDGTLEQAASARTDACPVRCLRADRNHGKGHAVRRGMLAATGDVVFFTDADLSTPVEEIGPFLAAVEEGHPVVIGSRRLASARVLKRQPALRQWMGRVFSWLARRLVHPQVTDFTCGFKAFRRDVVPDLFGAQTLDGWAFDAEILHIARRRRIPVRELPVRWSNRPDSRVRLATDVATSAVGLARVVWRGWRGRYDRRGDA